MVNPTHCFDIPSVHDDTHIECRVYHPKNETKRGAVFAHPYAPLGGSFDDEVVLSVVRMLLNHGYLVGTFNFRGAGNSKGRTSWTSKPELGDYVSVVGFLVAYLSKLHQDHTSLEAQATSSNENLKDGLLLLLGGYSYGGLLTIQLPPLKDILDRFNHAVIGSAEAEIRLRADTIGKKQLQLARRAHQYRDTLSPRSPRFVHGGEESEPGTRRVSRDSRRSIEVLRRSMDHSRRRISSRHTSTEHLPDSPPAELTSSKLQVPNIAILLVSPLLPPLAWLIAISTPSLAHLTGRAPSSTPSEDDRLSRNNTFVVFGDRDNFTSIKRFRRWSEQLRNKEGSKFKAQEVSEADHFWRTKPAMEKLRHGIEEWLGVAELAGSARGHASEADDPGETT